MLIAKAKHREFGFSTKAGEDSVIELSMSPDGVVSGRWDGNLRVSRLKDTDVLDDYANCPNHPLKVRQFLKKHGPVCVPAVAGAEFRFTIGDWLAAQTEFRKSWDRIPMQPGRSITFAQMFESWSVPVVPTEFFTFGKGELLYKAETFHRLMMLELYSMSPDRVRKCRGAQCTTPYYIAHHGRQRYCGETCQKIAQQGHSLKYWNSTGRDERRRKKSAQRIR